MLGGDGVTTRQPRHPDESRDPELTHIMLLPLQVDFGFRRNDGTVTIDFPADFPHIPPRIQKTPNVFRSVHTWGPEIPGR